MKPTDILREIAYPLTNVTIVFAMLFYWFLFGLAQWAGLFGIVLLALTLPAYFRFLLYLLEERANNRPPPVPDITMFNPADNMWSLTPLILIALLLWADRLLIYSQWAVAAAIVGIVVLIIAPASMAILAVTHSPSESLNPAAIVRMIRVCGVSYFAIPAVVVATSLAFLLLVAIGVPLFIVDFGTGYQVVLLFSFTGSILRANDVAVQVDIPAPVEKSNAELADDIDKERQQIAAHAYGFVSRGNRDGGLAHIRQWIGKEADTGAACKWFFNEMLKWESKDAALFFGQDYFAHLLNQQHDTDALKLISRCLHEDSRWRPLQRDRDAALHLAEKYKRTDLLSRLKS